MKKPYSYKMFYPVYIHGKGTYSLYIVDGKVHIPALEQERKSC